jgi:hypothetical protein
MAQLLRLHADSRCFAAAQIDVEVARPRPDCLALPRNSLWQLGLSALTEETSGRKLYWAQAYPPGRPDFHHAVCFVHELSPAAQP